jgi:hypothetical protein
LRTWHVKLNGAFVLKNIHKNIVLIAFVAAALFTGAVLGSVFDAFSAPPAWTFDSAALVSISLAAVTLVLAALAFLIAILSVWGWNAIEDKVEKKAADYIENGFKEGNNLDKAVKNEVREALRQYLQTEINDEDALAVLIANEIDKRVPATEGIAPIEGISRP